MGTQSTYAADSFTVTPECRKTINADLQKVGLRLTQVVATWIFLGGSDGASSWDTEYVVSGYIKNKTGKTIKTILWLSDNANCRVLKFNR